MARKRKYGEGSSHEVADHQGHISQPGAPTVEGSGRSVAEHQGRVAQPGVPTGPRQTYVPTGPTTVAEVAGPPSPGTAALTKAADKAARVAKRAETRQRKLVSQYVVKAYSRKLERKGLPTLEINARISKAKSQLEKDRERLLSHPAVQQANAEGKVVNPKGLRKIKRSESRYSAIKGPSGLKTSPVLGTAPRSLTLGSKDLQKLERIKGTPQGGVGRTQALAKEARHEKGEPSTLETLSIASLGIPGIGLGVDAARLGAAGARVVPELLAEGGARQAAKSLGASAASKAGSLAAAPGKLAAAGKAAPKAIKELPSVLRAGAKEAPSALKAGAKAAPKAVGKKGVQGAEHTYQAFGGAAVLGTANKAGLHLPGGALLEGQARAFDKDPGKVLSSTANLAPALLTSALQLPAAAGKSVITGSSAPLEGALDEQVKFAKHFAETYGSSDPAVIEKATLEEGFLPEVLIGPLAAKGTRKGSAPFRESAKARGEASRAPATDEQGNILLDEHGQAVRRGKRKSPAARERERAAHRREESLHGAFTGDKADIDAAWREHHMEQRARKAAGKQTVIRENVGEKGKDTLHARPVDFVPFLAKAHIDLNKPDEALREVEHYASLYEGQRSPAEAGINPDGLTARDAVRYLREHPEELRKPALRDLLDSYREVSNGTGEWEGARPIGYSERDKEMGPAVAHGRFLPEEYAPLDAAAHTSVSETVDALRSRASELRQKADKTKSEKKAKRYRREADKLEDVAKRSEDQNTLTREGAWAEHRRRKAVADDLRKAAHEKLTQAKVLTEKAPGKIPSDILKVRKELPETPDEYVKKASSPSAEMRELPEVVRSLRDEKGDPGITIENDYVRKFDFELPNIKHIVYRDESGHVRGMFSLHRDFVEGNNGRGKDPGPSAPITNVEIVVDPAFRRKGIASKLAKAAHDAGYPVHRPGIFDAFTKDGASLRHALLSRADQMVPEVEVPSAKGKALRQEAKDLYAAAKAAEAVRKDLHRTLDGYTRPGAKPNYNAKREAYSEAVEQRFLKDIGAFKAERGLHPEGVYVPDQAPIDTAVPDSAITGGKKALEGVPKINTGKMWRQGFSRQGYDHLKNEGILRPLNRAHHYDNGRRFVVERSITYNGEQELTGREWGDAERHGLVHSQDHVFVPTQVTKRLERKVQGGETTEHEDTIQTALASSARDPKQLAPGTKYRAFPRAAWEEFVAQQGSNDVLPNLRKANRATSRLMLSTPSFLLAQTVAEPLQSIASVSPHWSALGLKAYGGLTWDQKVRISAAAGETASSVFSPERVKTALDAESTKPFKDSLGFFQRHLLGRVAKDTLTLKIAGELDRLKGSKVRRATLTGEIARDLNGMRAKTRKLMGRQRELEKKLNGKSFAEQQAYIADHPDALMDYMHDLHGAMGGWNNLTRSGHVPETKRAAALIFYPYLRMSIQWPLRYAGRHPVKATLLAYLAAENNFALKEALHGEPSFLNYAQIPTWKEGPDGKPTFDDTINLSRIAPGGNAITQAVQGSGSLLGALQPTLTAAVMGATGQGPLGPVEGGVLDHIKAAGASILGLSPYIRAADTLKGQKDSGQSEYGVLGKRANIALNPLAALSAKLKGAKGEQVERALGVPFLPQNLAHQRDYAKLGRILTKLGDTGSSAQAKQQASKGTASEQRQVRARVEKMQKENSKAENELEAMYAKYGLSKVAARSLDVYKYTHPYPDEEGSKSPFEGSGFGGGEEGTNPFEGSGFGGSEEKPIPVPQQTDGVGFSLPGFGGAVGAITSPLAAMIGGEKASAAELPVQAQSKDPLGKKTVGKPSARELIAASKAGTLEINHSGKIVTPAIRRASQQLRRAETRAVPKIEGIDNPDQREFAEYLSHYSKLPPKLVGEWVKQEGGGWGSDGVSGGEAGEQNWLGVGYPGQQTPMSQSPYFNNTTPKRAAKATAEWIDGKIGHEYQYRAAPSIQEIGKLAKAGAPESQIKAYIEGPSAWGTGAINQSGIVARGPEGGQAAHALKVARRHARSVGLNPTPFNGDIERGTGKTVVVRADAKGMVNWAKSAVGTPEGSGKQLRWNAKANIAASEPWCAAFVGAGLERRGVKPPSNAAYSGSYLDPNWTGGQQIGTDLSKAKPGDLMVFGSNEHIALYVGNGEVIAGNYGDEVARYRVTDDSRGVSGIVRPKYKGGKVKFRESAVLTGSAPETTFGGVASAAPVEPASPSAPAQPKGKPRKKQQGVAETPTERLTGLEKILGGDIGVPTPGAVGPSVAHLAALGAALEEDRRKLLRN